MTSFTANQLLIYAMYWISLTSVSFIISPASATPTQSRATEIMLPPSDRCKDWGPVECNNRALRHAYPDIQAWACKSKQFTDGFKPCRDYCTAKNLARGSSFVFQCKRCGIAHENMTFYEECLLATTTTTTTTMQSTTATTLANQSVDASVAAVQESGSAEGSGDGLPGGEIAAIAVAVAAAVASVIVGAVCYVKRCKGRRAGNQTNDQYMAVLSETTHGGEQPAPEVDDDRLREGAERLPHQHPGDGGVGDEA